jgi:hypothetical protein
MIYPHLSGKLPSVLRPGKGRHLSDLIVNVPTLIILAALIYAASSWPASRRHDGLEAGQREGESLDVQSRPIEGSHALTLSDLKRKPAQERSSPPLT